MLTVGLEVMKLEFLLRLKIKRNDWLLEQPINTLYFQSDLYSSFITSRLGQTLRVGWGSVVLIVHIDKRNEDMLCFQWYSLLQYKDDKRGEWACYAYPSEI